MESHKIADIVFVREPGAAAERFTLCHELGHVLGLGEQWIDGRPRGSCMTSGSSDDYCPSIENLAEVDAVYAHDDGYTTAGPVGEPIAVGQDICSPATPTPTATATATPTQTPVPTATPTATPTPCLPPTAKRCR